MIDEDLKVDEETIVNMEIDKNLILTLQENAVCLTDNRLIEYTYHSLESILLIVIFGIMARCNTFVEIFLFMQKREQWLKKYVTFDFGLPSLSTIKRVIGMINPSELEELFNSCLKMFLYKNKKYYQDGDLIINDLKVMDGKTANSSNRKSSTNGEVTKVNAMSLHSVGEDICEATEFIEKKTNEIPTGIKLLKRVNIENCIIEFDALNTQTETIAYIADKNAYYVAPVKGNQKTLEEDIALFFSDENNYKKVKGENYLKKIEKAHSNVETREYLFSNDINWLPQKNNWKKLKSIGFCKRTYTNKDGIEVTDTRYYISNIDANKIKLLSNSIRGAWQIENGLHLYLDMVFQEDENKCFLKNSQKNLNLIRKFVLALLKRYKTTTKLSMNSIRFNISMDFENEIDKIFKLILF